MNYDPASRLRAHIDKIIEVQPADPSRTLDLFRKTRLLLEKGKLATMYPTLKLYCDWAEHANLDRKIAWSVLTAVDKVFVDYGTDPKKFSPALTEAMSVRRLRSEFLALYQANNIKTFPFDYADNWKLLLAHLFEDLEGRPIGFDEGPLATQTKQAKIAFAAMVEYRESKGRPARTAVRRIFLSKRKREGADLDTFFWNVRMAEDDDAHYAELEVPVVLTVAPNDFLATT